MSTTFEELLERVERLEDLGPRVAQLERCAWRPASAPITSLQRRPAERPAEDRSDPAPAAPPRRPRPRPIPEPASTAPSLEDLLGGRVLAWAGGFALLAGVVLLFAMAVSRGWLGEGARTLLAAAGALALGAAGIWLRERRGRLEAAVAAVAASAGALLVTVTVASRVYDLLPPAAGIALALAVGAAATALALRWNAQVIGALGLLGGVAAPLLAGAPFDATTIAVLAVAMASATVVCVRRDWAWLSSLTFLLALPQWGSYVVGEAPVAGVLIALGAFGTLSAAAAAGHDVLRRAERLRTSSAWLICAGAVSVAALGWFALHSLAGAGAHAGDAWLTGLALTYLVGGMLWRRAPRAGAELGLLALTIGVVLADVAIARLTDGLPTTLLWLAGSLACAGLARRASPGADRQAATLGLGAHLALGIVQALLADAAPGQGEVNAAGAIALLAIAATCLATGRLSQDERPVWRPALDLLAIAAVSYLTALTTDGVVLVAAWAAESVALAKLWRRTGDPAAGIGAGANLALALGHALVFEAPVMSLAHAVGHLPAAVGALGAACFAAAVLAQQAVAKDQRDLLASIAGLTGLYLLSVAVVALAGNAAQPALSATWALSGVLALVVGLNTDKREIRRAALALLGVAAGKVFVLDLARLDALPRVVSFLVLGLLLLVGALAWQRARPIRYDEAGEEVSSMA